MNEFHFGCTRCGKCCPSGQSGPAGQAGLPGVPLGLAEALDYDREFLLALTVRMETWNLGDFDLNRPEVPISLDDLLTALAFRKDKLATDMSRDIVFQMGRVKATGERIVTFLSVHALALGDTQALSARCPALSQDGACSLYDRRPLACRVFPLDPLYPEMLQGVPLAHQARRLPCDFSGQAPLLLSQGSLKDAQAKADLEARQETIRRDSLFLPFYGLAAPTFAPMLRLADVMLAIKGTGRLDLPFLPALAFLTATGRIDPERAELCVTRQAAKASDAVAAAMARKNKAERSRTTLLRNSLTIMESFQGRIQETADALAAKADQEDDNE